MRALQIFCSSLWLLQLYLPIKKNKLTNLIVYLLYSVIDLKNTLFIVCFALALCCGLLELKLFLHCSALHTNVAEQKESVFNLLFYIKRTIQN